MVANVEEMFSVREVPWHGLGKIVAEAPDSIEAITLAGLNWTVDPKRVFVDGKPVPNYFANVRSDNNSVLGIVSERYKILQNQEAFNFTDALIDEGEVTYETAGSLRDGKTVWMLAKMNIDYNILGDKFDPYLCFTNTHDGTGAVRAMMTPIRVVCQNTLNMAIQQANRSWSTTHVGDFANKLAEAQRTLGLANKYMAKLEEEADILAQISIPDNKLREVLNELLPMDFTITERQSSTVQRKREGILRALQADDIAKFTNTGWAFLNAVSDYEGHSAPTRNTSSFQENRFAKIVGISSGESLFDKTYDLLKKVA